MSDLTALYQESNLDLGPAGKTRRDQFDTQSAAAQHLVKQCGFKLHLRNMTVGNQYLPQQKLPAAEAGGWHITSASPHESPILMLEMGAGRNASLTFRPFASRGYTKSGIDLGGQSDGP